MSEPPQVPSLRVELLGPPRFTRRGVPVRVDTRKALALLAVVAVAAADGSGPVARERLAAMFWPEADGTLARGALRRTLSVLGAAAGDAVLTTRETVGVRPEQVVTDVATFRRLAADPDREQLSRAVALVRGEFLEGFAVRDSAPFDDWTAAVSARLARELGSVLERLVAARVEHGELHRALADAGRWLELDPLHEPAHRLVLRLLAWTGRREDALAQYDRCVRVLGDSLGVAPVRATTRLYEAVRTGTLAPPPTPVTGPSRPRSAVPPAVPPAAPLSSGPLPMVGRDDALARLLTAAGRAGRVCVVSGESGVGRSRLVEEFAARTRDPLLARAHGGEAALSFALIADLVREAVARIPVLDPGLAVEISRIVPECLPAGRQPALPLTSPGARDRFHDAVARVLGAVAAGAVVVEDVHAASAASAEVLAYLLHRLDRLGAPLVLTWRDPGLPLRHPVRVALAGGRLGGVVDRVALSRLTAPDVAALVAAAGSSLDPDRLWADSAGLPMFVAEVIRSGDHGLPTSVRDLLAARVAEVSEETAQVLGALAVLGGVADPAELRATGGRTELETVEAVEEALGAGLVREEGAAVAFTHDALRLVVDGDLSRIRRRLLHARAAEVLEGGRDTALRAGLIAHHWHEAARDDLAVGWAWTAARRAAQLFAHEESLTQLGSVVAFGRDDVDVALATGAALVALARYEAALVAYRRAGSLAPAGDRVLRARIERRSADVHARSGDWDLAESGLAAAAGLLDGLPGSDGLRAEVLADRAVVAARAGDTRAAAAHVTAALAAGRSPRVQDVAGLLALDAGDTAAAEAAFRSALEALEAAPDLELEAAVLNNLARTHAAAGDPAAAVETARRALAVGETHGDRHRLAALHANLADRLQEAGAPAEAMTHLKAAAGLFAEVGADPLDHPRIWTLTSW